MRSMTGFGRAEITRNGIQVTAEVRTLNQRFLELKLNVPRGWGEHEAEIRRLVQQVVSRGRVEVFIRYVPAGPPSTTLRVNEDLARKYVEELRRLGKKLGLNGGPGIEAVLQRPEIFQVSEEEIDSGSAVALALSALKKALRMLDLERAREGKALKADFSDRLSRIEQAIPEVQRLAEQSHKAILENFQRRVGELLKDLPLDERRLYEEAASAAQHVDITEELTRLRAHLQGMSALLSRKGPIGKPVEFLLQELNREVNTVGSKSQNPALSRVTVDLKGEIEKMREQVQNVE
ncbi:MAG: YicC family protein [Candidatus Binataceae bacterium]|nr:YicC family protein [Candidatus Binataceae bacterium]